MATEYKLSYTASEIDEKLGKIDKNTANISKLSEDIAEIKESLQLDNEENQPYTKVNEGEASYIPEYTGYMYEVVPDFIVGNRYLIIVVTNDGDKIHCIGLMNTSNAWELLKDFNVYEDVRYGVVTPSEVTKKITVITTANAVNALTEYDYLVYDVTDYEGSIDNAFIDSLLNGNSSKKITSTWKDKKALVIGDSLTASGVWQKKLTELLGMKVVTHAKGGAGIIQCVKGKDSFEPLKISEVHDKNLIIFFAGYNNRGTPDGKVGDCYKDDGTGQSTIAGFLQYAINCIFEKLQGGVENGITYKSNLTCRVMVVTPHCAGKYSYIDVDGYGEYPSESGYTMQTLAQIIEDVAHYNNLPCYNAWKNSGINRFTWNIYSASSSPDSGLTEQGNGGQYYWNADQLHLNKNVGYPHLGTCIAKFVDAN